MYKLKPARKWYDLDKGKPGEKCVGAQIWPGQKSAEVQDLDGNDETVSTDRLSEIESGDKNAERIRTQGYRRKT